MNTQGKNKQTCILKRADERGGVGTILKCGKKILTDLRPEAQDREFFKFTPSRGDM